MTHPWVGRTGSVNLGVLTQWVTPEVVARAVAGRSAHRERRPGALPAVFTAYFELALALFAEDSYEDVVDNLVSAIPQLREHAPAKSSLVEARRRLGQAAMRALFEQVAAGPVAGGDTRGSRWRGYRTLAVDGFVLETPDTPGNRAHFGAPTNATAHGDLLGYPLARVVTLVETGTRAPVAGAIGTYHTGEPTLALELAKAVGDGDVVLFDRHYPSVKLWKAFTAGGAAVVMRANTRIARTVVAPLPDGSHLARIWSGGRPGAANAEQVTLRVIEYRVDGGETIRLLTSLLDPEAYPAAAIAALYPERWQQECSIGQLKIHQHRPETLRSRDPDLVRQEIWAMLTIHHTLIRLITRIADERRQDPENVCFTKVLKDVRRTVIQQSTRTLTAATRRVMDMADDIRRYLNPTRRSPRTSPRRIKRIRTRYKLRPAATRGTPVTTKTPPKTITLQPIVAT